MAIQYLCVKGFGALLFRKNCTRSLDDSTENAVISTKYETP